MASRLFLAFIVLICLSSCSAKTTVNTTTVKSVDIDRYLGTWYEIARYPHSFEKDLVGVTANYEMREDGKINVVNSGYKDSLDGEFDAANGVAKIPNPDEPGKLKVSFFLFFYADYYILDLDTTDYQYALVGSSSDDYLWILYRHPQMPEKLYQQLVNEAEQRGYDISKLSKVPQPELN